MLHVGNVFASNLQDHGLRITTIVPKFYGALFKCQKPSVFDLFGVHNSGFKCAELLPFYSTDFLQNYC